MLFIADDPADVIGTVSSGCRRLGNEPYPGDAYLEQPMAHRRNGLPQGPPPISVQLDAAAALAADLRNGAPSLSPSPNPSQMP